MHCIEILGPEEVIVDAPRLDSSIFTRKERHVYFNVFLILNKGRHTLLMHVFVYPFLSLGMYTYMRICLSLLDLRRIFKGSSLIYVSYLSFFHSGRVFDFPSMHRARTSYMRARLPLYERETRPLSLLKAGVSPVTCVSLYSCNGRHARFHDKRRRAPSSARLLYLNN
jgi:hypothetical protein